MILLAFDTATGPPGLCLRLGEERCLNWRGIPRSGPQAVLNAARELLEQAGLGERDVDAIGCGRGPGAFTGVRLGIALAQGFALGVACPVIAVSDLAALAWRAHRRHAWPQVCSLLDARQGEIYAAAYRCLNGEPREVMAEALLKPRDFECPPDGWALAGSGVGLMRTESDTVPADATLAPDAEAVAELAAFKFARGEMLAPEKVLPTYLRERVANPKRDRQPTRKA